MPGKACQCWGFTFKSCAILPTIRTRALSAAQSGITLIELLVVVLLIGIATAVASAKLFPSAEETLQQEGERVLAVMQFARDEAAFGGRVVAVAIDQTEIRFLERDLADPSRWNPASASELKTRQLPASIAAALRVGAVSGERAANARPVQSHVVFLPVGIAAPFELTLQSAAGARHIRGDALGNLLLSREPS